MSPVGIAIGGSVVPMYEIFRCHTCVILRQIEQEEEAEADEDGADLRLVLELRRNRGKYFQRQAIHTGAAGIDPEGKIL